MSFSFFDFVNQDSGSSKIKSIAKAIKGVKVKLSRINSSKNWGHAKFGEQFVLKLGDEFGEKTKTFLKN